MTRVLAVVNDLTDPPGLVGRWLAAAGHTLDVVSAPAGAAVPPAVPAGIDGVLVLGGEPGPLDDDVAPWLPAVRALVRDAVERAVPLLGICLGHELLAVATGGSVARAAVAEVGVCAVAVTAAAAADPVLGGLPAGRLPVVQFHVEEVVAAPPGAVVLAVGEGGAVQAIRVGPAAWGLQFHPEVDAEIMASWLDDLLPQRAAGRLGDDLVGEVRDAGPRLAATWRPVVEAWGRVVRRGGVGAWAPLSAPPPPPRR